MKKNIQTSFSRRIGARALFLMTVLALAVAAVAGLLVAPGGSAVSAQEKTREIVAADQATAEMIRIALDFRAATAYTVFAERGISADAKSEIKGSRGVAARDGEEGSRVKADLAGSFNAINQLPSTKLDSLSGGAYRAGSYSAKAARLSGAMTLDGGGDANAIFIFRVDGSLRAESDFALNLVNGAEPQNVFFVSNGDAAVAEGVNFRGSILAMGSIEVGAGAKVEGRLLSSGGEVKLTEASVGGGTGIIEICKAATEPGLNVAGLTVNDEIVRFNTASGGSAVTTPVAITGTGGESVRGIDYRPSSASANFSNAILYGITNTNLYTINPFTGVATLVGPHGIPLATAGTVGFDFNPTNQQIRVVTDNDLNYSVNPDTGVGTAQTAINPATADINAAAYTNSVAGATTTTLYTLDDTADTLNIQAPPASGTQTVVGPLGVNVGSITGFDISPVNNTALATINNTGGTDANLYRINLATGAATFVSTIDTNVGLRGLAITPGGSTGLGNAEGLEGRIFRFRIGNLIREAPVGSCTGPIDLPAGPVTIEELIDGRTLSGGNFSGRFRLVNVTSSVPGSLGTVNLPLRTAVVNVREGSISNQTVVTFTNTFAINAVVEICKRAALSIPNGGGAPAGADSPDVTGFFNFTIDALPGVTFPVPVGACSGPIQVNVPTTPNPVPAPADVLITEIGRDGFTLESASTFPADRFNFLDRGIGVISNNACIGFNFEPNVPIPGPCVALNPGGGVVSADVLEGGVESQTTVNFFNRANPAVLKVCKIAGPGIPEGTPFTFEVRGTGPSNAAPGVIAPGAPVFRTITVPAGPAAQGGFCDFVRADSSFGTGATGLLQTFIVGTPIAIVETDFLTPIPGVGPGQVRTGNIRSSTGFTPVPASVTAPPATNCVPGGTVSLTAATGGNPDLEYVVTGQINPACNDDAFIASAAIVPSRAATVEVEFTNFVFNPTLLKICKVAGNGIAQGTPFNFTVTVSNPATGSLNGPLFDPRLTTVSNVTVQAGPASSGGFCSFAQGPFTATNSTPPVGTFNVGSTVTIAEVAAPGTTVVLPVTSPTGTVTPVGANGGSLVLGFRNGFNEITFVNAAAAPAPRAEFDFDGDGKSDPTIFRPATGTWWYAASGANGAHRATNFGLSGDKLVAADYDGDGRTDYAVYRKGIWHIMGSTSGYRAEQFGMTTEDSRDIPQTGDFDGDGKADLAIYRPSNGVWYKLGSRDGFSAVAFGLDGDKPVAADFDGDRKTDVAVYRAGTWHLLRSSEGYTAMQFGLSTEVDTPVAADYDGDGRADAAVFRNDGVWHLLRSRDGYASYAFGLRGDVATPADYNGDGKTDLAVYRSGVWHLLSSGQGEAGQSYSTISFGGGADQAAAAK